MLEFEHRVGELPLGSQGYVFSGAFHIIDGRLYIDDLADCPEHRRHPEQICVGRKKDGSLTANFKNNTDVHEGIDKIGRTPIHNCGVGKVTLVDLSETRRWIDSIRSRKE